MHFGVSCAYVSKIENERLDFGDSPRANLIRKLAEAHRHFKRLDVRLDARLDRLLALMRSDPCGSSATGSLKTAMV